MIYSKLNFIPIIVLMLFSSNTKIERRYIQLNITPLNVSNKDNISLVKKAIENFYKIDVTVRPEEIVSKEILQGGDTINAQRALDYLVSLKSEGDNEKLKNLAITENPLTMGSGGFIMRGLAKNNNTIISTELLYKETDTPDQFNDLLSKVALHEVGHLLGLEHCTSGNECFMVSSLPDPAKFRKSKLKLCQVCKEEINPLLR